MVVTNTRKKEEGGVTAAHAVVWLGRGHASCVLTLGPCAKAFDCTDDDSAAMVAAMQQQGWDELTAPARNAF